MLKNIIDLQDNIYINGKCYNINKFKNINKKHEINEINEINNINEINDINQIYNIKDIIQYLQHINSNLNIFKNYFILYNDKIISNTTQIRLFANANANNNRIESFQIIEKIKGGGLLDAFMSIIQIGQVFMKIGEFIIWLLKFLTWFIEFIIWFVTDFLNPKNFFTDFFQTLMLIVASICKLPLDLILAFVTITINTIGGWMQGFWGWDMSGLTKNDKNSKYFKSYSRTKGQKTYLTNTNTVPFSIILGTIICPPMGVFMDMGTSGWLNIIVCCLLTLCFYIPGLCYALLIIYS